MITDIRSTQHGTQTAANSSPTISSQNSSQSLWGQISSISSQPEINLYAASDSFFRNPIATVTVDGASVTKSALSLFSTIILKLLVFCVVPMDSILL